MDAGFVTLFSVSYTQELLAELHLITEGLALTPISKFTPHCNGKAILPNTLGANIEDGRELLSKFGFEPILNEQILTSWAAQYRSGINEIVGCSNGIPWCLFEYESNHGRVVLSTLG